jgi:anti-sigma B factor antagonist
MPMQVKVRCVDRWKVIRPSAALLYDEEAKSLKGALENALADGTKHVVLDLSEVRFLSSVGLGIVISYYKRLSGDGRFVIAGADANVLEFFRITKFDQVLEFQPAPEAVLERAPRGV